MILENPTGETLKLIQEKLNENEETREQYLVHIKEWLKNEPHLPDEFDDRRILTFLRSCKFSLERCKQKIDMYFTVRTALPELFTNRDVYYPEMKKIVDMIFMFVLPGVTSEGYRLSILGSKDAKEHDIDAEIFIKYMFMMADVRLVEENVIGDIYILDVLATNSKMFMKLTPTLLKKILVCGLEAYPIRVKAIHLINVWPWLTTFVNSLKPLLKEKIRNRIFFHNDINALYDHVPKDLLPNEYGGQAGTVDDLHAAWVKKIGDYTSWFKEQENIKADASLRRDKSHTYDEVFGVHGSFRQLSID